ncbi:MAG: efflux RND transporter permease subunit, partial [Rickettsiales bacterium]
MNKDGLIGLFARHPTAANLLMVTMIIAGFFALHRMNTQFFPDFGIDIVSVSVEWSGASAEDVDSNIVQAIEPEVRFLDSVKRVRSSSIEGKASISIEFNAGTDMQSALSDVETAVSTVTTLPVGSEQPEVRRIVRYDTISRLVLSGPVPEASLKQIAKRIRDGLLDRGIDQVDLFGAREEEIWVEIQPESLLELDLTLEDISDRIAETSQDLPSGDTSGDVE